MVTVPCGRVKVAVDMSTTSLEPSSESVGANVVLPGAESPVVVKVCDAPPVVTRTKLPSTLRSSIRSVVSPEANSPVDQPGPKGPGSVVEESYDEKVRPAPAEASTASGSVNVISPVKSGTVAGPRLVTGKFPPNAEGTSWTC